MYQPQGYGPSPGTGLRRAKTAGLCKQAFEFGERPSFVDRMTAAVAPGGDTTARDAVLKSFLGGTAGGMAGGITGGSLGSGGAALANLLSRGKLNLDPVGAGAVGATLGTLPGLLYGSARGFHSGAQSGYAKDHPLLDSLGLNPFR